jgi:uncharacterized protein (TIGR02391 family)
VLDEMSSRNLVWSAGQREDYLPTAGSFALLGDDHSLYQLVRTLFERTINALWELYRSGGCDIDHEAAEFVIETRGLNSALEEHRLIPLALYLVREFGVLQPTRISADQIDIEKFRISEQVVKMRDPKPWWMNRVKAFREPLRRFGAPAEQLLVAAKNWADYDETVPEAFDQIGFWSLIHPNVEAEARPRFEARHYADAVEWALKVVAEEIRRRTGLKIDGSDLMHKAFSPSKPRLVFPDPIPSTQLSMQTGYMEVFAGAMTGIRNPKAHGMVQLDRHRCIHFLFLVSLLAYKVDEAVDAP